MWEYFRCLLHQVQKLCNSETLLDFKTYIPGSPRQSNFPFQVYTLLSWSAWSRSTAAMWRSWSRLIPITSGSWTVLISPAYTSLSSALTISNALVVAVGRVKPTLLTCPKAHQQRQRRSKWFFFSAAWTPARVIVLQQNRIRSNLCQLPSLWAPDAVLFRFEPSILVKICLRIERFATNESTTWNADGD